MTYLTAEGGKTLPSTGQFFVTECADHTQNTAGP